MIVTNRAGGCTCPILDGWLICGSSCPLHGFPQVYWPDSEAEAKANGSCGNRWLQKPEYKLKVDQNTFKEPYDPQ